MADTTNQFILDFFEQRRIKIIALQEAKKLKASGLSARLLTIEHTDNRFQLIDKAGYFNVQEFGKKPSRTPFQAIYDWLEHRKYGIDYTNVHVSDGAALRGVTEISPELNRRRIAWAILKKHAKLGSFTYRNKRQTGVLQESLNDGMIDQLLDKLSEHKVTEVKTDILGIFK